MTIGGPDPNKECVFPFAFSETHFRRKWVHYNACALDHIGTPWCPTKLDSNGRFPHGGFVNRFTNPYRTNTDWGYCENDCPISVLPAGNIKILLWLSC